MDIPQCLDITIFISICSYFKVK